MELIIQIVYIFALSISFSSATLYPCDVCLCDSVFEMGYCTNLDLDKIPDLGYEVRTTLDRLYLIGNRITVIQPFELSIYKAERVRVYMFYLC